MLVTREGEWRLSPLFLPRLFPSSLRAPSLPSSTERAPPSWIMQCAGDTGRRVEGREAGEGRMAGRSGEWWGRAFRLVHRHHVDIRARPLVLRPLCAGRTSRLWLRWCAPRNTCRVSPLYAWCPSRSHQPLSHGVSFVAPHLPCSSPRPPLLPQARPLILLPPARMAEGPRVPASPLSLNSRRFSLCPSSCVPTIAWPRRVSSEALADVRVRTLKQWPRSDSAPEL